MISKLKAHLPIWRHTQNIKHGFSFPLALTPISYLYMIYKIYFEKFQVLLYGVWSLCEPNMVPTFLVNLNDILTGAVMFWLS